MTLLRIPEVAAQFTRYPNNNLGITPIPLKVLSNVGSSNRYYFTPNNIQYPSVTTVLGAYKTDWKDAWIARVGINEANRIGHYAASRGKIVHSQLEKYLQNEEIDYKSLMPDVRLLIKSILPTFTSINSIVLQETTLYSDNLRLAGTADLICYWDNKLTVVDFKTSVEYKNEAPAYLAQVAGYAVMFTERYGFEVTDTRVIIGVDSGKRAQILCGNIKQDLDYLIEARNEFERRIYR